MITVPIKPVAAYVNGKKAIATQFNVVSLKDNLFDNVSFLYTLMDADGVWAGEAVFELKGREEYTTWDASPEGAYRIVAQGIGLELIPAVGKMFTSPAAE